VEAGLMKNHSVTMGALDI